jgi:GT2 family glycosyltransferase
VLGVSIVLYNSPVDAVVATLRALPAQTVPPAFVAIHANAMADDDRDVLTGAVSDSLGAIRFTLSTTPDNLGFSGAHNALLRGLFDQGCHAVAVLNPDLVLGAAALETLQRAWAELPGPALLGPALELADPVTFAPTGLIDTVGIRWTRSGRHLDDGQGEPVARVPLEPAQVAGLSGACLFVPRSTFDLVEAASGEFFDEDFIAYREDAELAIRAGVLGVSCYLVPSARGEHVRRLRGTERGADPFVDALGVRNRFLIAFKYGLRRPGRPVAVIGRDVAVIAAVLVKERSSMGALRDAWRLRKRMRAKGRQIRAFATRQQ